MTVLFKQGEHFSCRSNCSGCGGKIENGEEVIRVVRGAYRNSSLYNYFHRKCWLILMREVFKLKGWI